MTARVFVEGGGPGKAAQSAVREAFHKLFEKLRSGARPKITPCGSRGVAYRDFKTAVASSERDGALLLVDSEAPVAGTPWAHLGQQGFPQPPGAPDDSAHLMVECMEAWLVADAKALEEYFGEGFKGAAIPRTKNVESIDRQKLMAALEKATRGAKTKGRYDEGSKARHSFELLGRIDAALLTKRAPHVAPLVAALANRLDGE